MDIRQRPKNYSDVSRETFYETMARAIAIVNQKGGVGKTTTAINLGACLTLAGKKVLLLDMDPQANATTGLGLDYRSIDKGSYDLLLGDENPMALIKNTTLANLSLVPATKALLGAEVELTSLPNRARILKQRIQALLDSWHYILIDCPPSLGFLTINALVASESVIVPIQCEYYALEGLTQLLHTLETVKATLNPNLSLLGLLLTMFDPRNTLSNQVAQQTRQAFGKRVFSSVIPRNVRLGEAPSHGKPIIQYDIKSKGAQGYLSLAQELINILEKGNGQERGLR